MSVADHALAVGRRVLHRLHLGVQHSSVAGEIEDRRVEAVADLDLVPELEEHVKVLRPLRIRRRWVLFLANRVLAGRHGERPTNGQLRGLQ